MDVEHSPGVLASGVVALGTPIDAPPAAHDLLDLHGGARAADRQQPRLGVRGG